MKHGGAGRPAPEEGHTRLLLVDDNPVNLEYFTDALAGDGYDIVTESDGVSGRRRALAEPFDIILLDVQMPGMSGDAVCSSLRESGVDVPILALTSAAMPDQVAHGMAAGFTEYLTKPIAPGTLRAAVRRHRRDAA